MAISRYWIIVIAIYGILFFETVAVSNYLLWDKILNEGSRSASYDAFLIQAENTSTISATLTLPEGAKFNHSEGFHMDHATFQAEGKYSFSLQPGEEGIITYWGPDKRTLDLGGQSENMRANVTRISSR